jgi:hypothetical protein
MVSSAFEVEPLVLQRAPPRLDDRVGVSDLDEGKHSAKVGCRECSVDGMVDVLDPGIGNDLWLVTRGIEMTAGSHEHFTCTGGI